MSIYPENRHHRNYGCRLRELVLNGYRALMLENEKIRVTILIDKGTDIYEFLYKPKDVDFLWKSRLGLREMRSYQPMRAGAGGMFLDFYEGGWQELFPWGGHASDYRGVNTGLHGEVALEPWQYRVDLDTPEEIQITCSIRTRRAPFLLTKSFALRRHQPALRLTESAVNESGQEQKIVWGHHPAFGWPFLDDSCVVDLPSCRVMTEGAADETSRLAEHTESAWPYFPRRGGGGTIDLSKIPGPVPRSQDLAFLHGFAEGWYALRSRAKAVGIGLAWDATLFPWLWYWQCFGGSPDYPFWGSEYIAALEPVTSRAARFADAIENGTARSVPGGGVLSSELCVWAFESDRPVTRISMQGVEMDS
jgi:hypothetical protein